MTTSVDDALQKIGGEITATLVHTKKLFRIRNQLCSPLLRLPTETIIRILSFIMADLNSLIYLHAAMPIYGTCHRIHKIMCHATELWWRVNCARIRAAQFILLRSGGDPQAILLDLRWEIYGPRFEVEKVLDNWRDKLGFKGHRLHTLEFCGSESAFSDLFWIFERPLPRVEHLKIHIGEIIDEESVEEPQDPVPLELPAMPLRVLDLRNVTLSWSQSHLFSGLRELHLSFRDCDQTVTIPEEELFGIFDAASPRLEHLSLLRVGHPITVIDDMPLPPKRILRFPNLVSLSLENEPAVVKYTLGYMDLPVIGFLEIRSLIPWSAASAVISLFFPDYRLPLRLFLNPSTFVVRPIGEQPNLSIEAEIGRFSLQLDFPFDEGELGRNLFMTGIPQLVPPFVNTLILYYTNLEEQGWRDFFMSHPEVRSIKCTEDHWVTVSRSLWNALSPTGGEGADVPCPKLESISIEKYTLAKSFKSLADCLRNRQIYGSTLKHFKLVDHDGLMSDKGIDEFHKVFDPLVGTVERFGSRRRWGIQHKKYLGDLEGRNRI